MRWPSFHKIPSLHVDVMFPLCCPLELTLLPPQPGCTLLLSSQATDRVLSRYLLSGSPRCLSGLPLTLWKGVMAELGTCSRGTVFSVLLKTLHCIAGLTDAGWYWRVGRGRGGGEEFCQYAEKSCCALWMKVLFSKPSSKYLVFVERHFREYTVVKFVFFAKFPV